jgi:histidinol-phosphate aminotransferase
MISLALPGIQKLAPYEPGRSIADVEQQFGQNGVIKLASNENPLGPPPAVLAMLKDFAFDLHRYPDGNGTALKQVLAEHLNVSVNCLTLGNGSNDVLELAARTFAGPEHQIVFSQYGFLVYPLVAQAIGAEAVRVDARDYGHDLIAMADAVTARTRVMFLANPNNPTGTWSTRVELIKLLDRMPDHVVVVLDQAYFEYLDDSDFPNGIELIDEYPNLIVTRTFSKVYGLAGLRIGYAVANSTITNLLNRVRQPFNANTIALEAARMALDERQYLQHCLQVNRQGLIALAEGATALGLSYIPSVGNFLTIDFREPARRIFDSLLKQGVIVRPLENYGLPNHLRITVGSADENRRFLAALAAVLEQGQ